MLTQKQERFTRNLFEGVSQREAWVQAGYSSNYSVAIIDTNACNLANTSKIKTRLQELNDKADSDSVATVLERKQVLTEIIRGRFADFMTNLTPEKLKSAALQEIKITETGGTKTTTIKLEDKAKNIDLLNKMEKLYTDGANVNIDNRTLTINVNSEETKDLTERLIAGERTDNQLKE